MNLKPSTLLARNVSFDDPFIYDGLENDMAQEMENILKVEYGITADKYDLKLGYSLRCSQGDGVCFVSGSLSRSEIEKLTTKHENRKAKVFFDIIRNDDNFSVTATIDHSSRNCHEHSFTVEVEIYHPDLSDEEMPFDIHDVENLLRESVLSELRNVCKKLEQFGYGTMEYYENEFIKQKAFEDFCLINNIENVDTISYYEFEYEMGEKPSKENMMMVWDDPKNKNRLWMNIALERKERIEVYYVLS